MGERVSEMAVLVVLIVALMGGTIALAHMQTPEATTLATAFVGSIGAVVAGLLAFLQRIANGVSTNGH